jgi:hypothetical protein
MLAPSKRVRHPDSKRKPFSPARGAANVRERIDAGATLLGQHIDDVDLQKTG